MFYEDTNTQRYTYTQVLNSIYGSISHFASLEGSTTSNYSAGEATTAQRTGSKKSYDKVL